MLAEPHGFFIPEGVRAIRWEVCRQDGGELSLDDTLILWQLALQLAITDNLADIYS